MKKIFYLLFFLPLFSNAQTIMTIAGGGTGGDGGPATNASIAAPYGLTIDDTGNIYIGDNEICRIKKVRPAIYGIISAYAGNGSCSYGGDNGSPLAAGIINAIWIHAGHKGELYIADIHRLRRVGANGIIKTIAGTGVSGYNGDGILATAAQINGIHGITTDDTGNVYFIDGDNHRIRKIDTSGFIHTLAGTGVAGFSPDGSRADTARLNVISMITIDKNNQIYFTESSRVRKIDKVSGFITTVAGNGIYGFSGDEGVATAAQIKGGGIAVDTSGNLYIADGANNRIRKVGTDEIITTIAGTGVYGFYGDGGDPLNARLASPQSIVLNKEGDIFIGDIGHKRVRVITKKPVNAIEIEKNEKGISIQPNPVSDACSIVISAPGVENAVITITDITGRKLFCEDWVTNKPFNLKNKMRAGIYVVTATTNTQILTEKMMVQ